MRHIENHMWTWWVDQLEYLKLSKVRLFVLNHRYSKMKDGDPDYKYGVAYDSREIASSKKQEVIKPALISLPYMLKLAVLEEFSGKPHANQPNFPRIEDAPGFITSENVTRTPKTPSLLKRFWNSRLIRSIREVLSLPLKLWKWRPPLGALILIAISLSFKKVRDLVLGWMLVLFTAVLEILTSFGLKGFCIGIVILIVFVIVINKNKKNS
jgi:hypothetical protein